MATALRPPTHIVTSRRETDDLPTPVGRPSSATDLEMALQGVTYLAEGGRPLANVAETRVGGRASRPTAPRRDAPVRRPTPRRPALPDRPVGESPGLYTNIDMRDGPAPAPLRPTRLFTPVRAPPARRVGRTLGPILRPQGRVGKDDRRGRVPPARVNT